MPILYALSCKEKKMANAFLSRAEDGTWSIELTPGEMQEAIESGAFLSDPGGFVRGFIPLPAKSFPPTLETTVLVRYERCKDYLLQGVEKAGVLLLVAPSPAPITIKPAQLAPDPPIYIRLFGSGRAVAHFHPGVNEGGVANPAIGGVLIDPGTLTTYLNAQDHRDDQRVYEGESEHVSKNLQGKVSFSIDESVVVLYQSAPESSGQGSALCCLKVYGIWVTNTITGEPEFIITSVEVVPYTD
jgi:hypothetical protein